MRTAKKSRARAKPPQRRERGQPKASEVTQRELRDADAAGQLAAIHKAQAVIEFAMDGTILSANDNFLRAMGYTLDEVQHKHHRMFLEPEYARSAEYRAFWERLQQGKYDSDEYKRLGKGGARSGFKRRTIRFWASTNSPST